ncbi:hypothetical protein ACI3PL_32305, partial [Lacticaseibacillus paracasei]
KYEKSAGIIRNKKMAEYASRNLDGHLVALWDYKSKGTESMIQISKEHGMKIDIIDCREIFEKYGD